MFMQNSVWIQIWIPRQNLCKNDIPLFSMGNLGCWSNNMDFSVANL